MFVIFATALLLSMPKPNIVVFLKAEFVSYYIAIVIYCYISAYEHYACCGFVYDISGSLFLCPCSFLMGGFVR